MNLQHLRQYCACPHDHHECKRIVLTGGPGAGKTAVLEMAKKHFCEHMSFLPEAAGIVYGGGFWRHETLPGRRAAQRAIFHVQREMENMVEEEHNTAIALCDRGSLDGLAYWVGEEKDFWNQLGIKREQELARYSLIIHLRTPDQAEWYNHSNPLRTEDLQAANKIDDRIVQAWEGHPRRVFIEGQTDFLTKASMAIKYITDEVPACCHRS